MHQPPERAEIFLAHVRNILNQTDTDSTHKLMEIWSKLGFMHNMVLANMMRKTIGDQVYSGPFKGMRLTSDVMTEAFGPVLLGTYEHELHDAVERIIATPYQNIVNIGCGFGYYLVGFALRMPAVKIFGYDINPKEQKRSQDMAALNGVEKRVSIGGLFDATGFADYAGSKTLVMVDIEGEELAMLDPAKYPVLQQLDILVELHDCFEPSISKTIRERFASTHDIEIFNNRPILFDFTPLVGKEQYIDPYDSLIITSENRSGPTPWAFMRVKSL